ncbi:hypothetical protein [Dongia sedimenti]|uniref:Major facilitator superfamily (MFS) profile domain-containing protein n=1 Tax=Dongia sedimenti TaxID=3064282 RepID=A0ABU0YN13_9PROT|nr:hypothetical protein [Rhodospirillaceae bacterium R-7]
MLGSIMRLAMLAGTGAGMAAGFRRAMFKLAALFVAAVVIGLMVAAAIGTFGVAIYLALAPEIGSAGSAAVVGGILLALAVVLGVAGRYASLRRSRMKTSAAGLASGLGGPLGAAALGASMGAGPGLDIKGVLERNAVTVLLTAFIAGMVMNNRRR